jgi:uncharacterized protein YwgA/O-acetyl-ADP-ribose deacetylase (regulator of RNase III)
MIKEVRIGNLLNAEAQTLVNTVNCVGIMGKGIALEFKKHFPDMFADYAARCKRGEVRLGVPYLYRGLFPPYVLNFPTKQDWRSVSRLGDIIRGLEYLVAHYQEWGIDSLAVPPLGCGNGGLEWRVVGPTLYRYLNRLSIPVYLYAPLDTPPEELGEGFLAGESIGTPAAASQPESMLPAWVALVEVLHRMEQEPFRWPVGRVMFQKIAYFATVAGIPTDLLYERGSYGPFAPGLKSVVSRLVNNGLVREKSLGQMFAVEVGSTFADAQRAYTKELAIWESAIERVADLCLRMNTHQAEMAATVHFAAQALTPAEANEDNVLQAVMQWKQRRQPAWNEGEVAETIRNLAALGWIAVRPSVKLPLPEYDLYF